MPIDPRLSLRLFVAMAQHSTQAQSRRPFTFWGLTSLLTTMAITPALGQVLEISPSGAVITHAGPSRYTGPGQPSQSLSPKTFATVHASTNRANVGSSRLAIATSAHRAGLSPALIEAVAWTESGMNQSAQSPKGARGVMQLMPGTARQMGVDPDQLQGNVDGGTRYLSGLLMRFDGDLVNSLASYNAGPEAVIRHGGIPPYRETKAYVSAIMDRLADKALKGEAR